MTKNILITGGAGYIGSMLTPFLLQKGYHVTVLDNFMFNQTGINQLCMNKNFQVIKDDIRNFNNIKKIIKNFDVIIPLAALVGAPLCKQQPKNAHEINYLSTKKIIDELSKDQIVLMPTTNSAYGSGNKDNFCDEKTELKPISDYAVDKVNIEKELMQRSNSISFRLATVFGMSPRMRIDLLVNDFTYRAVKDGFIVLFESHFKRNYIHITDVCEIFGHALSNLNSMLGEIYNVGISDVNLSKLELCKEIKKYVPKFVFFEEQFAKDEDQRNYIVSNEKILKTGFKTKISISEGVNELIKGYKMLNNNKFSNV